MKKKKNILIYLLLVFAGMWILASGEAFYFYIKKINTETAISPQKDILFKTDTITALSRLKYWVNELASNDSLSHGDFGFCVATADSGKVIYESNSDKSLVPASIMKIVTTGVALKTIGAGYSFFTSLQYSGDIDKANHKLRGNIYIRGSGDPTLGSMNFGWNTYDVVLKHWLAAIKALGIDTISGAVIGDGELFDYDHVPGGWAWEDIENDYGAPPAGLSFRENLFDIRVVCKAGSATATIDPFIPDARFTSTVIYNPGILKSYIYVVGPPSVNERLIRGEVRASGVYQGVVPDPAYFCAYSLYKILEKNGITVKDSASTVRKLRSSDKYKAENRIILNTIYSPSLGSIVYYTNHVSQNMYAETLLKLISVKKTSFGSTIGGAKAVKDYWSDRNIDMRGFYMADGSGVSRMNGITARQLTYMLVSYASDSEIFKTFYNSLPVVGRSILLVNRPPDEPIAKLEIHAKSGYMSRVRSFSGYIKNKNGKLLAFTMIVNNHEFVWWSLINRLQRIMRIMYELE
jgi:serine-type D-Ala-D-Ala carboxypeptidase/endopeptidase (penicillin-binding protein 4)